MWGLNQAENVEIVHSKFCKRILNVKMTTNSLSLLSELGRFPLIIGRKIRIVKYWLKLFHNKTKNCILSTIVRLQNQEIQNDSQVKNWCNRVKSLLESSGFNEIWLYPESVHKNSFIPSFTVFYQQ